MRLDDLKNECPVMPEKMRSMVEQEVAKQINQKTVPIKKKKPSWKKTAVVALVATMAVGTTVFAGTRIYRWNLEKEGTYGLKANVIAADQASEADAVSIPDEIPTLSIEAGYLPEGMIAADDSAAKYHYENTPYLGGISIDTVVMDEELSKDQVALSDQFVTTAETVSIQGQQAVYLEKQVGDDNSIDFDKKIYIAYPEYWQILEIFVGDDVSKEEALKIAENLQVKPTDETVARAEAHTWSDRLKEAPQTSESKVTASSEELEITHKIGDAFTISKFSVDENGTLVSDNSLQAKVVDVQIADDLALLDDAWAGPEVKAAADADGKLLLNEITYMKAGNGTDSLDEILNTETVNQKLVYATVEYTNTGADELNDFVFFGTFVGMTGQDQDYTFYERAKAHNADFVSTSSIGGLGDMDYYDLHSGERNNNHIASLKPGETVTVHLAKVVNADELDKMYLSLDTYGGAYEFTETALQTGYVDIRQ